MMKSREDLVANIEADKMLRFLVDKRYRFYRHLILWLFVSIPFYKTTREYPGYADWYIGFASFGFMLVMIYLNIYQLVPRFLFKRKYVLYTLSLVLLSAIWCSAILSADRFIFHPLRLVPREEREVATWIKMAWGAAIFSFVSAAFTAVKLFQRWIIDSHRIHQLEKSRMQSELGQLKSQINPHFLFNMLNNANVLTQQDPAKASEVLMRLSELLRYQLYDSARSEVLLSADINFLSDFLTLEKIRRDQFDFEVTSEGDINGIMVPPFLFITFVENAVKHNMDAYRPSYVRLHVKCANGHIHFTCVNSKPQLPVANGKYGGLGLVNAKRRLELLFPDKHMLLIDNREDIYTVKLQIDL